jgi:glycogen debranching enzyme
MASLSTVFRKQYGKAIYAGSSHFHDYWARDALFACYGALALKDYAVVRRTLLLFLNNIDHDGHVPLRIGAKNPVLKYLRLPTKEGVWHAQDKGDNPAYDGNALLLILAERYEQCTNKPLPREKLRRVVAWIEQNVDNNVLAEGPYSSWEDSIKLHGPRLYTNVCLYRAWNAAAVLFSEQQYRVQAERTANVIHHWWNGHYFTDGPKNKSCLVAGNLLAIVWGLSTPEQTPRILTHIAKRPSVIPPAGFWRATLRAVYWPFFLIHLHDYHTTLEWSWLAAIEIASYRLHGQTDMANSREAALHALIERYDGLHEVYKRDKPVHRLIYRAETDFSWALGLLIASQPSTVSILQ